MLNKKSEVYSAIYLLIINNNVRFCTFLKKNQLFTTEDELLM